MEEKRRDPSAHLDFKQPQPRAPAQPSARMEQPLDPCDVEIFFASPEALDDPGCREAALSLLSADERDRVNRFHFQSDRQLHLAARALLRRSLSRASGVPPGAWRFQVGAHGKPEIAAPASPLRFNASHTRGLVMVSVVVGRDVGVDVERVPESVPFDVVDRSFAPTERETVRSAPLCEQPGRFAEIWTLKEAYVKARGLGLSLALGGFAFQLSPPRLFVADDLSDWHVESLEPTPQHRAAICVSREAGMALCVKTRWDEG
jgi:4'-phosphopantetheinyl transferase